MKIRCSFEIIYGYIVTKNENREKLNISYVYSSKYWLATPPFLFFQKKLWPVKLPTIVHQYISLMCLRKVPFWKLVLKTIPNQTFSWTKLILNLLSIIVQQYLKVMATILKKIVLQGQCYVFFSELGIVNQSNNKFWPLFPLIFWLIPSKYIILLLLLILR